MQDIATDTFVSTVCEQTATREFGLLYQTMKHMVGFEIANVAATISECDRCLVHLSHLLLRNSDLGCYRSFQQAAYMRYQSRVETYLVKGVTKLRPILDEDRLCIVNGRNHRAFR